MAQQTYAYSFRDVQASIFGPGGAFSLGYGSGIAEEGITIEMHEDKTMMVIGADGTPMHSLHAGQGGTVIFRLLKVSSTNAMLSTLYDAQSIASSQWGLNTITIMDISRGDHTVATQAAFKKQPNNTYAKDGNVVEWQFTCGRIYQLLGVGTGVAA